ncbi:MAG: DNA mismatch repair protein MutS [Bacteroidales bacterium]|nr:DNA mismatch repair protein MutS [Bacteroidales bacterium]
MKNFKDYIKNNEGLRFIFDNLKISSIPGRDYLLQCKFLNNPFDIKIELQCLNYTINFVKNSLSNADIDNLSLRLHYLNNISGTLSNLEKELVLDDIQLFEIKKFAQISKSVCDILCDKGFDIFELHDLSGVIDLLDPDNAGESSFYVYSSYSKELSELRKMQQQLRDENPEKAELIRQECVEIEDTIRARLSRKLSDSSRYLKINFNRIAHLDVLIAKAMLVDELNLCSPLIADTVTEYKQVFNPFIKSILSEQNKDFQAVDISLDQKPVLITGANMSGKTVLLRTLALSQLMFQFGFYVPAKEAKIKIVDDVILSIGDSATEYNGLSSFAMEILNINSIIEKAKSGKIILALVDELARTTNPDEGKALVSAFVDIMKKYKLDTVITTHYSGIKSDCRRLRVKGLKDESNAEKISVKNINDFMDYSLMEVKDDTVPTEAIRIAEILDVDKELIDLAKSYLMSAKKLQ